MAKKFSDDNKSVRVTGGESFSFDEFRKRRKQAKIDNMAKRAIMGLKVDPLADIQLIKEKNRAKAKKAMKRGLK